MLGKFEAVREVLKVFPPVLEVRLSLNIFTQKYKEFGGTVEIK